MPAITVGVAEVEERLRRLQRRVNGRTVLHVGSLGVSVLLLSAAVLLAIALRGSPPLFRASLWSTLVLTVVTVSGGAAVVRRRWMTLVDAARLADRHGNLTQRLETLIDLRQRPRPSRFGAVLVAQLFARAERWDPRRVAPRPIPRTVALPVVALAVLVATVVLERQAPAANAPAASTSRPSAGEPRPRAQQAAATSGNQSDTSERGASGHNATSDARGNAPSGAGPRPTADGGSGNGTQSASSGTAATDRAGQGDSRLAALPDRLQNTLRQALHGSDADGRGEETTRQASAHGGGHGSGTGTSGPGKPLPTTGRSDHGHATAAAGPRQPTASDRQDSPPAGAPRSGGASTTSQPSASGGKPAGGAGRGSSPTGLLGAADPNGTGRGSPQSEPFTLTITSFLHHTESRTAPPKPGRAPGGAAAGGRDASGAADEDTDAAETALADDALRKSEIPAAYEDIVRRVYLPPEAP